MNYHSSFLRRHQIIACAMLLAFLTPVVPVAAQGECAPVLAIEGPAKGSDVQGQIAVNGFAFDQNVADGSGIAVVEIYLDGPSDQDGISLGSANRNARPEIDRALGRTDTYGYTLTTDVSGLTPGPHTFYVYAWTACGPVVESVDANVTAPEAAPAPAPAPAATGDFFVVDAPSAGTLLTNGQQIVISGWTSGTRVELVLDGERGQGRSIGTTTVDKPRGDVAAATGRPDLANSGFAASWTPSGLTTGNHTLYVYSFTSGQWVGQTIAVSVRGAAAPSATVKIESPASGSSPSSGQVILRGYAVDCTSGAAAQQVRIFRGGTGGTLIGAARIGGVGSSRDLSQVCSGGGQTGPAAVGWSYTLDLTDQTAGSNTITAVGDFGGTVATADLTLNLPNSAGTQGGNQPSSSIINTGNCSGQYATNQSQCYNGGLTAGNCTLQSNGYYTNSSSGQQYSSYSQCTSGTSSAGNCVIQSGGYYNQNTGQQYSTYDQCISGTALGVGVGVGAGNCTLQSGGYYYNPSTGQQYSTYNQCITGINVGVGVGVGAGNCTLQSGGYYYNPSTGQQYSTYNQCITGINVGVGVGIGAGTCTLQSGGYYYNPNTGQQYSTYNQCITGINVVGVGSGNCVGSGGYYYNQSTGQRYLTYNQCITGVGVGVGIGAGNCVLQAGGLYYNAATGQSYTSYNTCLYGTTSTSNCVAQAGGYYYNSLTGQSYNTYNTCLYGTTGTGIGTGTCTLQSGGYYYNPLTGQSYSTYNQCLYGTTGTGTGTCTLQSGGYYYNPLTGQSYSTYNQCLYGTSATGTGYCTLNAYGYYTNSSGQQYSTYNQCINGATNSGSCIQQSTGYYYNSATGQSYGSYNQCSTASSSGNCVAAGNNVWYNQTSGQPSTSLANCIAGIYF